MHPHAVVTLHPEDGQQWQLCRLILNYTHEYIKRDEYVRRDNVRTVLPHIYASETPELPARQHALELIGAIEAHLQPHTNSETPVSIEAAWMDWQARQKAFEGTEYQPRYLAGLYELLKDLETPPKVPGLDIEAPQHLVRARVALLVGHSFQPLP